MFAIFPYFNTLSAEPTWRDNRRPSFPSYLQLLLNLNENLRPAFHISLHLVLTLNIGTISPCFPYFPTFSVDLKRRANLRFAFLIYPHLVLIVNVGKVFALLSLFTNI